METQVALEKPIELKKKKKKFSFKEYLKYKYFFLMLFPVFIYYLIFQYLPMYGIIIAFKDFYPLKGILGSPWAGLSHFKEVFSGLFFFNVFMNTIIISFYKLIFGFPAPIILAILINEVRHKALKKSIQSITYLPYFISWVVLAGIVIEGLSPSRGPINVFLIWLGQDPIYFIAEKQWFRFVIVVTSIWRNVGWQSIVFMAAISGIDPELYESADLDGAGRLRKMMHITLPSIAPVIIIMFIFATGNIIQDDFEQIYNLLNSKVMEVGDVISTYAYREGLQRMNYSYATAVGVFKNLIAFSLVMFSNFIARKFSDYALW